MNNFLASLPKNLLAFFAIAGGMIFIIYFLRPPHSICDSQIEVLDKAQNAFLFEDQKVKTRLAGKKEGNLTTRYERLRDQCDLTNESGGCYEYFQEMRIFLRDLNALSAECGPVAGDIGRYRKPLVETLEKIARIAWGSAPPASYNLKFNWLDSSDINLFCLLKERYIRFYGDESWERFRLGLNPKLPGSKDLTPNQIWDLSIFSENCARHP